MESLLTDFFIEAHPTPPKRIILDFDATHDPIHGAQLGRFFQGYYKEYCYLPLYVFCGEHLLCAQLRPADQDGAAGSIAKLAGLVERIRRVWPDVQIILRDDMQNRIQEQQLMLFADRTSAEDMRANQIRLYMSSMAYVLMSAFSRNRLPVTPPH